MWLLDVSAKPLGSVKPRYMLENPKTTSSYKAENLADFLVSKGMDNQQATCESRKSSTTTREASNRRHRNAAMAWYSVPQQELDLIEAHLLGDGCLYKPTPTRNAKFVLCRGHVFEDYTRYTWDRLPTLRSSNIGKVRKSISKRTGEQLYNYQFSTRVHPQLSALYGAWYPTGKKILGKELQTVTDEQLAIWWCDDGTLCYTQGHLLSFGVLSTCSFTVEENQKIVAWLQAKGLNCVLKYTIPGARLVQERGYKPLPFIYFRKKGVLGLAEIIRPHIPGCMSYKVAR